jgi:hypothetical protein
LNLRVCQYGNQRNKDHIKPTAAAINTKAKAYIIMYSKIFANFIFVGILNSRKIAIAPFWALNPDGCQYGLINFPS